MAGIQVTQWVSDQPRPEHPHQPPGQPQQQRLFFPCIISPLPQVSILHTSQDSVSDVLTLDLLMVPSVLKPTESVSWPLLSHALLSSPHSPCSSHVASALERTVLLPASGSLHMLFHLPRMLFPSFPSHRTLLPNHLMCRFLQAAHPDHPDTPAPHLDT